MDDKLRCQSCAMPLHDGIFGIEKDGSENKEYCKMCYDKGSFREPKLSMDKMIEKSVKHMTEELKMPKEKAEAMSKEYIPNLKRWKK